MLVVAINLDRAFRCIEADAASCCTDLVDIEAASFLDRSLPEVDGIVSSFNRVIRDAVFTVCFLICRDELLVGWRLGRLVVIPPMPLISSSAIENDMTGQASAVTPASFSCLKNATLESPFKVLTMTSG